MAVHGGDIVFDIKGNDTGFRRTLASTKATAAKAGTNIGNTMASSISKNLGTSLGKVGGPAMAKAGTALGTTFGTSMGTAIAAIPVAGWIMAAVGALAAITNKVATLGDEIDKNSQKMGMSAEGYQQWSYILERCGASMDSMKGAMKKLSTAAEKNNAAFTELGISQQELASMNQEQLFARTIGALQNVEDGTRRTYLASQLLGRGATELGAVFNMSNAETDALRAKLDYLGATMSEQGVKNSAAFKDSLVDLKMAFRGFGNFIAEYIAPIFTWVINHVIIPFIVYMRKLYEAIANAIRGLFQLIADVFRPLISLLGRIPLFGKVIDFFKGLGNKRTSKGIQNTAASMEDVSTGTGNIGSSAKKSKKEVQSLKRELLGFDKITKLQGENKGTSSDAGTTSPTVSTPSISTPAIDTSSMFDTSGLEEQSETWYQKLKKTVGEKWNQFTNWLDKTVGPWWDKHFGGKTFEIELPSWEDLKQKVDKGLGGVYEKARKWLKATFGIELPSWEELKQKVDNGLKGVYEKARKWLKATFGIDLPSWSELKQKLDNLLGNLWERFRAKNDGKISIKIPTWSELKDKVSNLKEKIKNAFKSAKISFSIGAVASWAYTNMRNQINKFKKAHPVLGKMLPNLPALAQGGFVKANTPQLAVIGDNKREGEIVAPESKLAAMAQMAANNANNQEMITLLRMILNTLAAKDTNVYLDGEEIKNNVVSRINRHTRATGQLEILI